MIKKLLTASLLLSGLATFNAQEKVKLHGFVESNPQLMSRDEIKQVNKSSAVGLDGDTLMYFYNKHHYLRTTGLANTWPTAGMPQPPSYSLAEVGSSFLNPDATSIVVSGAFILACRQATAVGSATSIPVRVYIYNASGTGQPGASPIATAMISSPVTSTAGTFYRADFSPPVTVTGAFHISYKAVPSAVVDTLLCFMGSAWTSTSTGGAGWTPALKTGEGLGYLKNTTNFNVSANAFGTGTEYEPVVVPIVAFSYTANGSVMAPNGCSVNPSGYQANVPVTFSNTSAGTVLDSRQFNWNAFAAKYAPFTNTNTYTPVADPVHNWSFTGPNPQVGVSSSSVAMPITHTWGNAGNATANLICKYQHSTAAFWLTANPAKTQDLKAVASISIANCGIVGINVNSANNNNLSVYPNPVVNGKATVSGLEGVNTVAVYNMLGQVVSTTTSDKEVVSIDLTNQLQGTYLIRITDSNNSSKTVKIINQ